MPPKKSTKQVKIEKPAPVAKASDMDTDIFCLHMTRRHVDSLGGLSSLDPRAMTEYTEGIYRSFHRRLHETRIDLAHEHESNDNPDTFWQDGFLGGK